MKLASLSAVALVASLAVAVATTAPISLAQDVASDEARLAELLAIGEPIFAARCKECHGSAGGGFIGPKFVANDRLATDDFVIRRINTGASDMPAFRNRLTPEEIIAVGTYIRNSWGNSYGILTDVQP